MYRLKLAAQAKELGRQIFASLPFDVRRATAVHGLIRLAFGDDETSLGLAMIYALVNAEAKGDIFGIPVEEAKVLLKKGSPKLYGAAKKVGNVLLKKGLGTKRESDGYEPAFQKVLGDLYEKSILKPGVSVPEAINYVSMRLRSALGDYFDSPAYRDRRKNLRDMAFDTDEFLSNPKYWTKIPESALRPVYDKLQHNPLFLDDEGKPRMYLYLDGLADGKSERAVADDLGLSSQAFRKWVENPSRQKALQKVLEPLLSYFD